MGYSPGKLNYCDLHEWYTKFGAPNSIATFVICECCYNIHLNPKIQKASKRRPFHITNIDLDLLRSSFNEHETTNVCQRR